MYNCLGALCYRSRYQIREQVWQLLKSHQLESKTCQTGYLWRQSRLEIWEHLTLSTGLQIETNWLTLLHRLLSSELKQRRFWQMFLIHGLLPEVEAHIFLHSIIFRQDLLGMGRILPPSHEGGEDFPNSRYPGSAVRKTQRLTQT